MEKKISIIIPVYNVELYIEECLESVVNQTYKNLEIILIDDGSTDNSGKICDKYAKLDSRIKVIHKKNGGAASAKNIGLKNITGEYVTFVDSDDFLDLKCIENKVSILENENADIVQSKFINLFKDTEVIEKYVNEKNIIYNKTEFLIEYINNWECSLFWNKIYKTELMSDIYFIEGRCIDDEFFTYKVIQNANKIIENDRYDYYYRQRISSSMNNISHKKKILKDQIDFIYIRFLDIDKKEKYVKNYYLEHLVDTYLIFSKNYYLDEVLLSYLKQKIKSILHKILFYKFKNSVLKILIIKLIMTPNNIILSKKNILEEKNNNLDMYFD